MTVQESFIVEGYNRDYITIGNFQSKDQIDQDNRLFCLTSTLGLNHSYVMYYYIDDIRIEELFESNACRCDLHKINIIPNNFGNDSTHCCYTVKIKSDSLTCEYNQLVITNMSNSVSTVYYNQNNFPKTGEEYTITSNYCIPRPFDGSQVQLKFDFIYKNEDNTYDTLCTNYTWVRCNCDCWDVSVYGNETKLANSIRIFASHVENTCCYDLFLENNSDCQLPFNVVRLQYLGTSFSDFVLSNPEQGWSYSREEILKTVTFSKNNPNIIYSNTNPQRICRICVNPDNDDHPIKFSIGKINNNVFDSCNFNWHGNLKCTFSLEQCCDRLKTELLRLFMALPDSVDGNGIYEQKCCWKLKVSETPDMLCPKIKKMQVFLASNLNVPIFTVNNPEFNNSSGTIFDQMFCMGEASSIPPYSIQSVLSLQVRFTDIFDSVCIKNITDTCNIIYPGHNETKQAAELGDDSNIDKNRQNDMLIIPNPFSSGPIIEYIVSSDSKASLEVFNSIGELVKVIVSGSVKPGNYSVKFDTDGMADGIYFIKLTNGDRILVKPVIKLR